MKIGSPAMVFPPASGLISVNFSAKSRARQFVPSMVAVHPVKCFESKICMNAHRQSLASSKGARLIGPIPGQMSTISFHEVSWSPETELRAHRRAGGDGKRRRANRDVSFRCNPTCCMAIGKHCSTRTQNWRDPWLWREH